MDSMGTIGYDERAGYTALFRERDSNPMLTMEPAYFVAWRKRQGLTQAQLAERWFVNLTTMKRWETGARKLPPFIGYIMAATENGLDPVGKEAMIEVDGAGGD